MIDAWPAMTPRRFFDILNAMNERSALKWNSGSVRGNFRPRL